MPHSNVAIFVPHAGCPNMCSFCNQKSISGQSDAPTTIDVKETCRQALRQVQDKSNSEIAFFGGSFTAIERSYMLALLEAVQEFIGEGKFSGIRISTRPDYIDTEILKLLKSYNVTAIELGVQSMSDVVLLANNRGHTSDDVIRSAELIHKSGIELGLQMMIGLYKSNIDLDTFTANEIIKLKPKAVRIYPVAILQGTQLADLYRSGKYIPMELDTAVRLCANLLKLFQDNGIDVIRLGLHASDLVENQLVGGLYHPAFRELCEALLFRDIIEDIIDGKCGSYEVKVPINAISKAIGQKKSNVTYFLNKGIKISIKPSDELYDYNIKVTEEV